MAQSQLNSRYRRESLLKSLLGMQSVLGVHQEAQ